MNPRISIIIPIYNAAELLPRCIESILTQTLQDFEIILVDDGSTDCSLAVCQRLAGESRCIKVFHKENEGQTSARKYGFEQSLGEYIYFVDADDFIPKNALAFLYNKAIEKKLDMVEGTSISTFIDIKKKGISFIFPAPGEYNKYEHLKIMYKGESNNGTHAILYKRTLFDDSTFNVPFNVRTGEDFYINLALSLAAEKIGLYNEIVYHYIENKQSITHYYKFTSIRPQEELIECTRRELLKNNVFHLVKEQFYKRAISSIFIACLHNPSLRYDRYIPKITKEAQHCVYTKYDRILCHLLLHPFFLPVLVIINQCRKYILKKI
uniref:Glycosyltransferase family 2 protein n=1 Tax=Prevotella sp. GTC17262 TaxID=3236797 RepID=A0AB33JJQ3_9BACT